MAWWHDNPERLEYELRALEAVGIRYEPDSASVEAGIYKLRVWPALDGEPREMVVTFPDHYPYFRFEIQAPTLSLDHHQNPFLKSLCFIGRETFYWNTTDTVAGFLADRLSDVVTAGTARDPAVAVPLEQARPEPFADYYPYAFAMCGVDSSWRIPEAARCGTLELGIIGFFEQARGMPPRIQAVVLSVQGDDGHVLGSAPPQLRIFSEARVFRGRWVRIAEPIRTSDPREAFKAAQEADGKRQPAWATFGRYRFQVYGALFPDEVRQRETGDSWLFIVRGEEVRAGGARRTVRQSRHRGGGPQYYFARAGQVGRSDLLARSPELALLANSKVFQVGLGALGAPSALELARAGVGTLHLMDPDHVDPATSVRWPFGLSAAGRAKVEAIGRFIAENYPFTSVEIRNWRIGSVRGDGVPSEAEILNEMLTGASLIYDATAEFGVQHFLSELARERAVPYVSVTATNGAWGGRIWRYRPGVTQGCWSCLQAAELDGTIPVAPALDAPGVQPAGCADPTFTGAGVDLSTIALQGVRLAVSTLCSGQQGGYPGVEWDVAVVRLRSPDGALVFPEATFHPLPTHPDCPTCRARVQR